MKSKKEVLSELLDIICGLAENPKIIKSEESFKMDLEIFLILLESLVSNKIPVNEFMLKSQKTIQKLRNSNDLPLENLCELFLSLVKKDELKKQLKLGCLQKNSEYQKLLIKQINKSDNKIEENCHELIVKVFEQDLIDFINSNDNLYSEREKMFLSWINLIKEDADSKTISIKNETYLKELLRL